MIANNKSPIRTREDLSFTRRDEAGRMINWPRSSGYGVRADWAKGMDYFDVEVAELASNNETKACEAIQFAITGMCSHYTDLEIGFSESVARAAILGLRAMRNGAPRFEPEDTE